MLMITDDTKHLFDIRTLKTCRKFIGPERLHHFAYRIEDIVKEVKKRSEYIAKNRRLQDGTTLIDSASYTNDEFDLDTPLTRDAMANVFIPLIDYTRGMAESYRYDDEGYRSHTMIVNKGYKVIGTGYTYDSTDRSVTISVTLDKPIASTHYAKVTVDIDYVKLTILDEVYCKELRHIASILSSATPTEVTGGYKYTIKFIPDYEAEFTDNGLGGEEVRNVVVRNVKVRMQDTAATDIRKGDWVLLKQDECDEEGELYICLEDCTSNVQDGCPQYFEFMPFDFRHTIHYLLHFSTTTSKGAMLALDTHIENALITYCLYKWFMYTSPEDSAAQYAEFQRYMELIAGILTSQSAAIVRRPICYI